MRFRSTVLLATLVITPVCADRIKASNSNERHIIASDRLPDIGFEGEGGEGDGGNVIGLSHLLRGGSFKAQHSAEAKITAMASFVFIGAAVAVVVSGGDVGSGGGSGEGVGGDNGVHRGGGFLGPARSVRHSMHEHLIVIFGLMAKCRVHVETGTHSQQAIAA